MVLAPGDSLALWLQPSPWVYGERGWQGEGAWGVGRGRSWLVGRACSGCLESRASSWHFGSPPTAAKGWEVPLHLRPFSTQGTEAPLLLVWEGGLFRSLLKLDMPLVCSAKRFISTVQTDLLPMSSWFMNGAKSFETCCGQWKKLTQLQITQLQR